MWAEEPHWPCGLGLQPLTSPLPPTTGLLTCIAYMEGEPTAKEGALGGYDSLAAPPLDSPGLTAILGTSRDNILSV